MNKSTCIKCSSIGMFTCNGDDYCYDHVHNTIKPINKAGMCTKDKLRQNELQIKINNLKILYERSNEIIKSLEGEEHKYIVSALFILNNDALNKLNTI